MSKASLLCACLAALATAGLRSEDFIDRVDEALTISAWKDRVRLRLSGTLDLEYYHLDQPVSGLFDTRQQDLFNPRLTFFLDVQIGPHLYAFMQARVDRGFDPTSGNATVRADEYALRFTPWDDGRLSVQVGKFAPVIGNWMSRHLSWDNPFITAPIPYDYVTAASDIEVPKSALDFIAGQSEGSYEYNPVIWNAAYGTGVSVSGQIGKFEYAAEAKNSALSSRPKSWDATDRGFEHPTVNARLGVRPNNLWKLGVSASYGPYLREQTRVDLPAGRGIGDYNQIVLGQDISFAWHHLQLWAEFYETRFEVPNAGNADTLAYYLEAKYKFTPEFFAALRWNQQLFANIPDGFGGFAAWGRDVWRMDFALAYRFTPHMQVKLQHSLEHETSGPRNYRNIFAAQFTLRF
ncbi:MAG: hypothetical protein ABIP20_13755 [Chthoniobacteraceae bacterium]